MEESELTRRQRDVVESTSDIVLVLGGAGCGKTTTALWAAREELLRRDDPNARIAFLTFSRTAVDQIASRLGGPLGELGDRIEVSTFHGLAYRLVRAFGRYVGFGSSLPDLQSPAEAKLHGPSQDLISYDDLIPLALGVLRSTRVRDLLGTRWPLIICDEFQDTSDEHWELLDLLRDRSRLLLLADPNQMIYTFLPGVSAERLRLARTIADETIKLEAASHRDSSGLIPAVAASIMRRDFTSDVVHEAVAADRLRVRVDVDDDSVVEVVRDELSRAWRAGARDYGIFGHSNEGVARLGHQLSDAGVDHVLVGLADAQGEAIAAMASMCRFAAAGTHRTPVRIALATFLTACSRGKSAPKLAHDLALGRSLPRVLNEALAKLEAELVQAAPNTVAIGRVVEQSWPSLGILAGNRPWARACYSFRPMLRRACRGGILDAASVARVELEARAMRSAALLDSNRMRVPATSLMNFHQTKGREADAVLLVYRDGDVLAGWRDVEPFEESSRVLYVALTRARDRLVVVLPPGAHPLVAPFAQLS